MFILKVWNLAAIPASPKCKDACYNAAVIPAAAVQSCYVKGKNI